MEKKRIIKKICSERNVQQIYGVPYNKQHRRAVQDFQTLAYDQRMHSYNLEDSVTDFLLYYNGRRYSTTKMKPYQTMMN